MDLARLLRAAETLVNIGQAVGGRRRQPAEMAPRPEEDTRPQDLAAGTRLFGQLEARLAGVLVSALKEAFDRDRAHLEMEREQIEHERKRTEELMRLEMLRQAGEREMTGIRNAIVVALAVWITSVLFMTVPRGTLGAAGIVLLAIGWAALLAALGASFAAYRQVATALAAAAAGARGDGSGAAPSPVNPLAPVIPWLIVLGLACTAAAVLVRLAT